MAKDYRNTTGLKPNHGQGVRNSGRKPRAQTLIDMIRDQLLDPCPFDTRVPQRNWITCIAEAELRDSLTNNAARTDLLNRLCGKPPDYLELTGKSGGAVTIHIVEDNRVK